MPWWMRYGFSGYFTYRMVVNQKALKENLKVWIKEVSRMVEVRTVRTLATVDIWIKRKISISFFRGYETEKGKETIDA